MLNRLIKVAVLSVPLLASVGCAGLIRQPTYGLQPEGTAMVRQVCSDVMGIRPGFAEFDVCADSLAQSVRMMHEADVISRTSAHCEREGFEPGTVGIARCVVSSKASIAQSGPSGLTMVPVSNGPPERSYWSASVSQQNHRMELSCAHLGLHPGAPGFGQCVANLRNALFFINNPL